MLPSSPTSSYAYASPNSSELNRLNAELARRQAAELERLTAELARRHPEPDPDVVAEPVLSLTEWSTRYRVIGEQPFTLVPPLEAIYSSTHPRQIIRKAAQVFVSEYLVNLALWACDTGQGGRGNSLYIFPYQAQMGEFSTARVDKAIEESSHLAGRVRLPANVKQKRIGNGFMYLRGASNRNMIISVDADLICCDEVAEYPAGTVDTVERRLGSSLLNWVRAGSTPRYPADEAGVLWDQSTQAVYEVRCSHCSVWQHLTIQTHLEPETGAVLCQHCRGDMSSDRLSAGNWVDQEPGRPWQGFWLGKLYSPRAKLTDLAAKYLDVLEGRATASKIQEFYNSDCGEPHIPEGGNLSPASLDACIDPDYQMPDAASGAFMGIDVGARHHVVILIWEGEKLRLVHAEAVKSFEDLDPLMYRYDVRRAVIDANPERTKAREFAERWRGRVFLAYYPNFAEGQRAELCAWDDDKMDVRINRTVALDGVMNRVERRTLILPRNARELGGAVNTAGSGEFYRHLGSPIRVVVNDPRGNAVVRYGQNGPDHFAHSLVYADTAASYTDGNEGLGILGMGAARGGWLRR
ncbi:MAG: hypothetical protein JWP44_4545 [Mucilaginibacter sp.]|nr:hypothetical protein [Mucilaginibacter sp.]